MGDAEIPTTHTPDRYLEATGRSLNALGYYRFEMYVANELYDRERASDDWR